MIRLSIAATLGAAATFAVAAQHIARRRRLAASVLVALVWRGQAATSQSLGTRDRPGNASISLQQRSPTPTRPYIEVGPNVQVSAANPRIGHSEVVIATDPADAAHVLACGMLEPSDDASATTVYTSLDRGQTWAETLRLRGDTGEIADDPVCAFGPGHAAYFVAQTLAYVEHDDEHSHVINHVYRSTDAGRTWARVGGEIPSGDRPYLVVNTADGNRLERGELFVGLMQHNLHTLSAGETANPVVVYRSADSGRTFGAWTTYLAGPGLTPIFGFGDVLRDGRAVFPLVEWRRHATSAPASSDREARGTDGTIRVVVADTNADHRFPSRERGTALVTHTHECDESTSWPFMPALAVDHSSQGPFRGRAYVVWPDAPAGRCEIFLAASADGGHTWSTPTVVNDDFRSTTGGPDDFHPMVAVNKYGVVGVSWYDRREAPDELGWRTRFAASVDGGETFLPSVPVATAPTHVAAGNHFDLHSSIRTKGDNLPITFGVGGHRLSGGETAGLAADAAGTFHALWVDNRTGVIQMWTAPVTVDVPAVVHGSPTLASFAVVSKSVTVHATDAQFDRAHQTITADVSIANTSHDTIMGPAAVRLMALRSQWARLSIMGSDNGMVGPGAVWDVTRLLPSQRLLPGERSGPLRVMLRAEPIDGAEASLGTYAAIRKRARRLDEQNVYDVFDALLTTTFQVLAKEVRPAGATAAQLPDSSATRGNR